MIRLLNNNLTCRSASGFIYSQMRHLRHTAKEGNPTEKIDKETYQKIYSSGYEKGLKHNQSKIFLAGFAHASIRYEKSTHGSTEGLMDKIRSWKSNSYKEPLSKEEEYIQKIKEEFFTMGYAHAYEKKMDAQKSGYQMGLKKGYEKGFRNGLAKAADLKNLARSTPDKIASAYSRLLQYITPQPPKK